MHVSRIACLILSLLAVPAFAAGYNFMKNSPFAKFNKEDMEIFTTTLNKALDESPDGSKTEWHNDKTRSGGSIELLNDPKPKADCRLARVANTHKTLKGEGEYQFCKKNGKWTGSPGSHIR